MINELSKLSIGDNLILEDGFGAIHYRGKGISIAGGTGVTPFISILQDLNRKDELSGNSMTICSPQLNFIHIYNPFVK